MNKYYQLICLKGHQITDRYDSNISGGAQFCSQCGKEAIYKCPECQEPISGYEYIPNAVIAGGTDVPNYCEKCGKKFPWANLD
ncbi:MAG: DUF2321 domain-containing protein [Candidatus Omnitrophota bacterium]